MYFLGLQNEYKGDFILMVQDWMHDHSREIYHRLKFDLLRCFMFILISNSTAPFSNLGQFRS
jgi:hypothetical protein